MDSSKPKIDVYEIVTNRIIELLNCGIVPWRIPWMAWGIPINLISKKPYRDINLWLLLSLSYSRNIFLTHDELTRIKGVVKKGQYGHITAKWKRYENSDNLKGEKQKPRFYLRYEKVFNIDQCLNVPENLLDSFVRKEYDPIPECEAIIRGMPCCPPVKHKGQKAFYDIAGDYINMPKKENFKTEVLYYRALFHQMVHSTGSKIRLNRKTVAEMPEFGSELFCMEELIAEMGASYLCSYSGIAEIKVTNKAPYFDGWAEKLKSDKKMIVFASSQAQKAVDYILNVKKPVNGSKDKTESSELVQEG